MMNADTHVQKGNTNAQTHELRQFNGKNQKQAENIIRDIRA